MKSIRREVAARLAFRLALVFLLSGLAVFVLVDKLLSARFNEVLVSKAQALISVSEVEDGELEIDFSPGLGVGPPGNVDLYEVVDRSGIRQFPPLPPGTAGETTLFEPRDWQVVADRSAFRDRTLADGTPGRLALIWFRPIDDNTGRPAAPYLLGIASSSRELDRAVNLVGLAVLTTSLAAVAGAVPIVFSSLRRGLAPLSHLGAEAASLGAHDLGHRFDTAASPEEIRPVVQKLNDLLERLDESFERERRFSSNASHELRSPIAEIRAIAELAVQYEEEASQENFGEICTIAIEMQDLIERLITLATSDSRLIPGETAQFSFDELTSDCLARRADEIAARDLQISRDFRPGTWGGDIVTWTLIVGNLIDNAVRYAPPGTTVHVTCAPGFLKVENVAPQLSPSDLPHLAERFWRKDGARSGYGSAGLGLSLVASLAGSLGASFVPAFDASTQVLSIAIDGRG